MPYVEADSFTTQGRVEALVARGVHDTTTKPTAQQVLDRMAGQAARIEAVLRVAGHSGTVLSGASPVTADTVLARLCDEANAFLAAAYVIEMHDVRDSDKALVESYLVAGQGQTEFGSTIGGLLNAIRTYVLATLTNPIRSASFVSTPEMEAADLWHIVDMRP